MTYLVRSNDKRTSFKKVFLWPSVFVVFLVVLHLFAPRLLPSIFYSLISPLWQYGRDSSTVVGESRDKLIADVRSLTEALAEREAISSSSILVLQENADLKAFFNRATSTAERGSILASVLKKPPYTAYDSLIIDIGKNHDVKVGQIVLAPGNIVIGSIASVNVKTSTVRLFSSPGGEFEVSFSTSSASVTAHGRGGGGYEAVVPRDFGVNEGDVVNIKVGDTLLAGSVDRVVSEPAEPFATILFSTPVNIYELRWVFVLNE